MSEPKFFSFRRPPDWRRGSAYQLAEADEGMTITSENVYRHVRHRQLANPQMASPILDTAVDAGGRWFMMDAGGMIWRTDLSGGHQETLTRCLLPAEGVPRIAVTRDALVILMTGDDSALQALSTDQAQIRWEIQAWDNEPIRGLAIAAAPDDGVLVLAAASDETLRLLRFQPDGSPAGEMKLEWPDPQQASGLHPTRFEMIVDADGTGWLLDRIEQRIARIAFASGTTTWLPRLPATEPLTAIAPGGAGSHSMWGLARAQDGLSQYALVRIDHNGTIVERGHTGSAIGERLIAGHGCLYLWDPNMQDLHTLRPVSETAVWKPFGRRMGVWISDALDSGMSETVWHKIVLDVQQKNDTQVVIRYYASDSLEVQLGPAWVHLNEYIAAAGIAPRAKLDALSDLWSEPLRDPEDALLLGAEGRYLWLYIELVGSERHAPVIRSLEVHFPRQSFLEYLPAIYQRDEPTKDFLERYLSLFQSVLDKTDRRIAEATRTFDTDSATGPSLSWLLGWLGIEAKDYWTEGQLHELLRKAPLIYSLRGTKRAMEQLIAIYTGEKPIILEYEQVKPLKENPELGEVAERLYAAEPHVFNVLVKAEHADTEKKRITLQQLIDAFKPTFATCKLIVLQPWVYMDLHSYLGVNTVLSEPTLLTLDGRSSMPHHTITIDVEQDNRMDQHTRLGIDSRLE
jgi:phage tail-like protein